MDSGDGDQSESSVSQDSSDSFLASGSSRPKQVKHKEGFNINRRVLPPITLGRG